MEENDKIFEGEYIRTNDGDITIFKSDANIGGGTHLIETLNGFFNYEDIKKHSKDIRDLVEADDCLIYKLNGIDHTEKGFVEEHQDARTNKKYLSMGLYSLEQIEILGIVTKEQFEANKFIINHEEVN